MPSVDIVLTNTPFGKKPSVRMGRRRRGGGAPGAHRRARGRLGDDQQQCSRRAVLGAAGVRSIEGAPQCDRSRARERSPRPAREHDQLRGIPATRRGDGAIFVCRCSEPLALVERAPRRIVANASKGTSVRVTVDDRTLRSARAYASQCTLVRLAVDERLLQCGRAPIAHRLPFVSPCRAFVSHELWVHLPLAARAPRSGPAILSQRSSDRLTRDGVRPAVGMRVDGTGYAVASHHSHQRLAMSVWSSARGCADA